ncbi:peptidase inhibitor family I36 protein [Streptomyces venezuelae]|uniref:peptidase inhibitor family I36 protein n=1 Tax=Streptomyces venezuelae TaxID=54571 RepID=UPI00278C249B|nr:peptidase inhibitor family I36 protein [Streptomyces venezuelae]
MSGPRQAARTQSPAGGPRRITVCWRASATGGGEESKDVRAVRRAPAAGAAALAVTLGLVMLRDAPSAEAAQGYERCPVGHACFFTEQDGQGEMCAWYDDEADWQAGIIVCAWGRDSAPRSAVNNGYPGDPLDEVRYFDDAGYQRPLGCLRTGERGDLHGDTTVRSLKWVPGC